MSSISARDFNHDVSAAKRAAADGPVIITDHGEPSHVLLSIAAYEELVGAPRDLASWLAMDDDIDFEPHRLDLALRDPDL